MVGGWYDRQIDLMGEINVYGTTVWSSSGYDTGIDNRQYALFQLKPELINSDGNAQFAYWLKNLSGSSALASVSSNGNSDAIDASFSGLGVRPRFLID